jgi:hypothetical protein
LVEYPEKIGQNGENCEKKQEKAHAGLKFLKQFFVHRHHSRRRTFFTDI